MTGPEVSGGKLNMSNHLSNSAPSGGLNTSSSFTTLSFAVVGAGGVADVKGSLVIFRIALGACVCDLDKAVRSRGVGFSVLPDNPTRWDWGTLLT